MSEKLEQETRIFVYTDREEHSFHKIFVFFPICANFLGSGLSSSGSPTKKFLSQKHNLFPLSVVRSWRSWMTGWQAGQVGILVMVLVVLLCLAAPLVATHDPAAIDLRTGLQPPSADHWLGSDQLGRDVWSRVVWAGRASLLVTGVVLALSLLLGLAVGVVSGYGGGWIDNIAMRVTDFFYALPQIMLALALIGAVGPSLLTLIAALTIGGWVTYARLARSLVLSLRQRDFVTAAQATGATHWWILTRHLLPGTIGPVAVQLSLDAGATILAIAALSFLGLGVQPPTPEWGAMLVEARPYLDRAHHLVLPPGLAIFLVVFGCNALGEALEDWLRPGSIAL